MVVVKEMEITITVSDDTEGNCDDLLRDAVDDLHTSLESDDIWEQYHSVTGDIDEKGWEVKWEYKTRVI